MGRKKKIKMCCVNEVDRFSNLPDVLVLHILSFLDTKYAVRTSVLSKRWNHLWTHLPSLNFSRDSFTIIDSFNRFIIHVLKHHKASNLHSLSFHRYGIITQSLLDRVIDYAVSHNVQQLHISFVYSACLNLPPSLLNCQSLRILILRYCRHIKNLPNSLVFASLTTLHLNNVSLSYNEIFCIDVFSSCVNLENLFLTDCHVTTDGVFFISAPQLVNLSISNLCIHRQFKPGKVVVCAPKLTFLNFKASVGDILRNIHLGLSVDSCPNLDKVNMQVHYHYKGKISDDQNRKREYISDLINVFQGLSNAKSLTVSLDTIKVLSMVPGLLENQLSPFRNLKSLKVKVPQRMKSFIIPGHVMTFLHGSSPNANVVVELLKV